MSRSALGPLAFLVVAAAFVSSLGFAAPDEPKAADAKAPASRLSPPTQEWRSDPACQLVFFAVLEGLYTDGVPDEVVDLIVPPKAEREAGVQRCFVFRCPLCHAAYEAFVLYQNRQGFNGSNEKRSTFGTGFDKSLAEALKSDKPQERVFAMGRLIRPWIEKRMNMQNLDKKESEVLLNKLLNYAAMGNEIFKSERQNPKGAYFDWQFYGGCQACEAAKTVAEKFQEGK